MKGVLIKKIADKFWVLNKKNEIIEISARGKLKEDGVFVGDYVIVEEKDNVITDIEKRKNILVRPPIANLDCLLICITREPKADLQLVDKLIITCNKKNIEPILVISKADILDENFVKQMYNEYYNVVSHIVVLSSLSGFGKDEFINLIKNKTSSLVGQSAVGKSSIMNMLGAKMVVGELSKKLKRGKNTTRHSEIVPFKNGVRLADTSGFSRFVLEGVNSKNLMREYTDFLKFSKNCKYNSCVHIFEKECDCAVKQALKIGKINQNRYDRYKCLYEELKRQENRRYC